MPTVLFGEDLKAEGVTSLLLEDLRVRGWGRMIASIGDVISVALDVEIEDIKVNVIGWPRFSGCLTRGGQRYSFCVNSGYRRSRRGRGPVRLVPRDRVSLVPDSSQDCGMVKVCVAVVVRLEDGYVGLDRLGVSCRGQDA